MQLFVLRVGLKSENYFLLTNNEKVNRSEKNPRFGKQKILDLKEKSITFGIRISNAR